MGNLALWIGALTAPLVARVLIALGFQVVTVAGMSASFAALKSLFVSHVASIPAAGFQMALLGGVGEAFGMIFGAIAFRLVLWNLENSRRILGKV